MRPIYAAAAALSLFAAAPASAASFLGNVVNGTYYFPDLSTVFANEGDKAVSPSATFVFPTGGTDVTTVVSGDQITLSFDNNAVAGGAAFNGVVITDLSTADITGATLDAASTISPAVTFTADSVDINIEGLALKTTDTIVVDVTFATAPEPAVWGLMLVGFAGLGGALRSRRRLRAA